MRRTIPCEGLSAQEVATGLSAWYRTSTGRAVRRHLHSVLDPLLEGVFGYYGVVVAAGAADEALLRATPVKRGFILGVARGGADLLVRSEALPVQTDSVDLVVLFHALDYAADPHAVLREVDRILIPEGHVIVVGFNPWSRFGLRRFLHRRRSPWCGAAYPGGRVRDWIALLGFELRSVHGVGARGAVARNPEHPFSIWAAGSLHVHHAVKRVARLTPIRSPWRAASSLIPGKAAEPTLHQPKAARAPSPRIGPGPVGR